MINVTVYALLSADPKDPYEVTIDQTRCLGLIVCLLLSYCSQENIAETSKFTMWKFPCTCLKNIQRCNKMTVTTFIYIHFVLNQSYRYKKHAQFQCRLFSLIPHKMETSAEFDSFGSRIHV